MTRLKLLAVLLLFGTLTQAQQKQNQHQTQTVNSNNNNSNSHNVSAQGGSSDSNATGGNASGQTNAQQSSFNENIPREAPPAIAPEVGPTVPCFKGVGGAASSPFGGISIGAGKIDEGCDDRETANSLRESGLMKAADALLCDTPAVRRLIKHGKLTLEECLTREKEEPESLPTAPAPIQQPITPSQIIVPAPAVTINLPAQPVPAAPLPLVEAPKKKHSTRNCPAKGGDHAAESK